MTTPSPRRSLPLAAISLLVSASVALGACSGLRRAVGAEKIAPDEFRVVTKAPLVIPPEYNLRPPKPGEPRPQELIPEELARSALYGQATNLRASDAEQLLVAKAGAASANPAVRTLVDVEGGGIIRKSASFANRIIFFAGSDTVDGGNPVDAVSEEERLRRQASVDQATGGGDVVIRRKGGSKLPGL
ncbi:MAG: DUF3035 domain-containing protein [Caulobacterales bacterium]|nr:DUF3035 domain-containing protein [Caulobacterales bacterium]